jgi:hypothetical protein
LSLSGSAEKLADSAKKIIRKIKVFRDEGEASKLISNKMAINNEKIK